MQNQIEYININKLNLLSNNPRNITKENFERLKQSIKDNPDYFEARPLIVSDRTGELIVIAGNQRLKASQELGLKQVPCCILKNLTEEREKEIIIRDNVELGDWDYDLLANEWETEDLQDWGVDIPFCESILDNLDDDCFSDKFSRECVTFSSTFVFPKDFEDEFNSKIGLRNKKTLTEKIINLIKKEF